VLLAYLPRAESSAVIDEVRGALVQAAFDEGKAAPALVQALSEPVALRRAVAAEALCQGRTGPLPAEVFSLLQDARPLVRLRAATGRDQATRRHDLRCSRAGAGPADKNGGHHRPICETGDQFCRPGSPPARAADSAANRRTARPAPRRRGSARRLP